MAEQIPLELGTEPVGKLLKKYAFPAIIAMTASSLYNMVDSIFIGQGCGPMAISGLALTFPLMNLSAAFGTLVGVGGATLISVLLGQKNYDTAKKVLGNVFLLNILIGLVFATVSLTFLNPILTFFGASEATLPYARSYMIPILLGNIITHLYFGLNSIVRVEGYPQKAMLATILTVTLNTALDPIFIFVLKMGIQGAAIATVISQCVALIWIMRIICDKNEFLHLDWSKLKIDWAIAGRSISIGLAPFLMNAASCFIVIFVNNQLKRYGGDLAIGAFGIVNRIVFLFLMIVMGFNQGMQPIAGYNYGAKLYDRSISVLHLTMKCACAVTTACFLVGMLFPQAAVSLFTRDSELIGIASHGFRLNVLLFPIVGRQMVISNFFQSLGMARKAIFLSLTRQLLFLLPALILFPLFLGTDGVWYSFPFSDLLSIIVAEIMLVRLRKQFRNNAIEPETVEQP
ncbi:MAG: MATE family efflux transporter [Bacteroidales bacterium]|nr:MATE family efflux transporter [Bacteroidales bacterium]